jgi:hypothetical protein
MHGFSGMGSMDQSGTTMNPGATPTITSHHIDAGPKISG